MRLKTLITTLGLGAGLMYFLDPQHGTRRRAMVRDKANRFVNDIDESLDKALEDTRNRARGVLSEMSARLSDQGAPTIARTFLSARAESLRKRILLPRRFLPSSGKRAE